MDQDWRALATQRAEYVSDRIRGLLSSGLDFLRLELGVDLGIKPEQYPSWLILSAALIGLTVLVLLAACGRRKRRAAPVSVSVSPSTAAAETPVKATLPPKTVKTEPSEPKKKNKKKAAEKKAQANGQTVAEPQEEIKVIEEKKKKPPPAAAPAPAQPPADTKTKKNKKKPKPEVKPKQDVSSMDGKEPDEAGAWETKVSNREKRQQRKKEKGPGDSSGSPVGGDRASHKVEQPAVTVPAGTKKNKESSRAKASKGDAIIVTSNCNDVNPVNGGGWTEGPVKSTQTNALNNKKLSVGKKTPGNKNRENSTWKQEPEGPWTGLDGRIKAEPKPVNMLRLNPSGGETGTKSNSDSGQWDRERTSEWSSLNGLPTGDLSSSDWNAPTELWENYEDPKVDAPVLKEMPVSKPLVLQESNDDNDKADPAGGGKSKRRKKKKRPEEVSSAAEVTQVGSAPAEKIVSVKPHPPHVPKDEGSKQNIPPQSSQKKSDQNWEPPKQVQKKKARRET
ncbi:protein LYRIC-like isoform X3 [Sinocyclocheilus rhinocerous]|uniref:protein LYRIC-like isoform X3 n=1 Tax=Sinocyclocheilus rhinocerous TaxID=307959 RepID=UPI0007B9CAFB|nr:PREDICTED: protein LYRIC-like isoform X3 [Sinocyclocheilus rhinocerous]